MRRTNFNALAISAIVVMTLAAACAKKDEVPPANGYPNGYPQGGYPPGAYPTATGYPQGGAYPTQTAYPTATAPGAVPGAAPAGTMATPNGLALPCQNDAACGFAKCNMQFQKCAFPCQNSALDCAQGSGCNTGTGLCFPGGG